MFCVCLTGCSNKHDSVEVFNKRFYNDDNVVVDIKEGYFYKDHEKFTVDDKTVGVTIYFTNSDEEWE